MSNFTGITKIRRMGAPAFNVPPGRTVEETLAALSINIDNMEQSIEGDTLILSARSGGKGAADVRITDDGLVVPRGRAHFPTDADIENIAKLFPEDNLFQTLEDPAKLQEYFNALKEHEEQLVAEKEAERMAERGAEIDILKAAAEAVRGFVTNPENAIGDEIFTQIKNTAIQLQTLIEIAVASQVEEDKRKAEEAEREAAIEAIRQANPGLAELDELIGE